MFAFSSGNTRLLVVSVMSSDVIVPKKQMVVDRLRRRMEQYRMRHKVSTEKMGQANTVLFERGFQQTQTLKQKFLETKSKKGAKNKNKSESTATQTQYARTIKQSVPASNSENGIKEELTFDTESLSKPLEYFLDGDDSCDEEAFSQFFRDLPNDLKFMEGEDIGSSLDLPDIGLTEQLNGSCSSTPSENNLKEEPRTPSEPRSQQSLSVPHTPKSESPFPPPSPGNIVGNPNAPGPIPASGAAQTLQKLARKHNQGSNNTSGNPCSSPVPTPSSATVYKRGTPSPASGAISPLDAPVRTPSPMRQQGPSPSFPGYQHLQHPHPYAPGASGSPLTNGQMHFNHMKQPPNFQPQMNSQQPSFHNGLPPRVPGTGEGPPPPYPGNGPAPMMMGGQMHLPQLPYSSAALDSTRAVRPVTTSTWNQIAVCPPSMSVSPSPMHMGGGPQMSFSQQRMGMPPSSVPMGVPPSSALPQGAMPPQMMGSGQRMVFHSMPGGRGGPPDAYMIPQGPQQTIMMRMPNSKGSIPVSATQLTKLRTGTGNPPGAKAVERSANHTASSNDRG
ncbi:unnamed protein product [Cyprideis torosa]|uniref:Uncharacterized protein n=1 Tax=Cyprideis torosa TaxID=163714 RepID=A0A7R8ZR20_9CRUS|nr:unnamed protein product [Cyprideis torosa]CAG0897807.1 unnamed protein product [Cyprideis torosa]